MVAPHQRLPLGIQHFEELRRGGYVYADKTDMVWRLANGTKFNYLSRPRRFGKSLLVDTLKCYFEGKYELFQGLKIEAMEHEWVARPVLHFDMSGIGVTADSFVNSISHKLSEYQFQYGVNDSATEIGDKLSSIITSAHQLTGQRVAVLIDEYDSPVRNSLGTPDHEVVKALYRSFLNVLKSKGDHIHCVFITGIAKFTQLSLFSALNTLKNWSFEPDFDTLCGLTDEEIGRYLASELASMAQALELTIPQLRQQLKDKYDGYHFSRRMVDVYNPTSVLNALYAKQLGNFWASDGASALLPQALKEGDADIAALDMMSVSCDVLETSDYVMSDPAIFLYQLGYLTIKNYDEGYYDLGLPNTEVRKTLSEIVLPNLVAMDRVDRDSIIRQLAKAFAAGDLDTAMPCLKQLVSATPYSNQRWDEDKVLEFHFQFILSTIFSVVGFAVEVERPTAKGRIDIVVKTGCYIYVIELKMKRNGGVNQAERQLAERRYADAFVADGRTVIPLAIEFDAHTRTISSWSHPSNL